VQTNVLSDIEITQQVNEFWDFIGNRFIKRGHYLKPLCDDYLEWKVKGRFGPFPPLALKLAGHATNFLRFKKDWDNDQVRNYVRSKLQDRDQVKSLLFEFRAATHFQLSNKDAIWLANISGKPEPDIKVITESLEEVYVECLRMREKEIRPIKRKALISDITRSLRNKNKQRRGVDYSLQVSLFMPEEVNWFHPSLQSFNSELTSRIQERFDQKKYESISGLTIVSYETPTIKLRPDGEYSYQTSSPALTIENERARHVLPDDFNP